MEKHDYLFLIKYINSLFGEAFIHSFNSLFCSSINWINMENLYPTKLSIIIIIERYYITWDMQLKIIDVGKFNKYLNYLYIFWDNIWKHINPLIDEEKYLSTAKKKCLRSSSQRRVWRWHTCVRVFWQKSRQPVFERGPSVCVPWPVNRAPTRRAFRIKRPYLWPKSAAKVV